MNSTKTLRLACFKDVTQEKAGLHLISNEVELAIFHFHCMLMYVPAINKLEKVALRCASSRGKPLVLIVNNVHFFENDEGGRNMLLQLQQKAEAWAASGKHLIFVLFVLMRAEMNPGIVTMVFLS